jgi:ubiquinone/menaquinone biosynthesis C-methylase UbiE
LPVTLQVMDAGRLSFPDASFDTVCSALSTCTFPDPLAALGEMRRVCRPGGKILLFEHGLSRQSWLAWGHERLAGWHYRMAACRWNQEPAAMAYHAGMRVLRDERHLLGIFHAITAAP